MLNSMVDLPTLCPMPRVTHRLGAMPLNISFMFVFLDNMKKVVLVVKSTNGGK